jgi:nucleoside-diphosphate-sugar epimerase
MSDTSQRTALILGATGSFGAHAMCALIRRGWAIRALARDPAAAARKSGDHMPIEWIKGDAMSAADVAAAARGAQLIVHAANPPGYKNWRGLAIPMLKSTIAAAKAEGARIVLPGNVYNFAPDAGAHITEDAPQAPVTRKGKVRVEMEAMLRDASESGVKVLILRAGDYFGPAAPNSSLAWLTTRKAARVTSVYRPGPAGHAFAYLPNLAETMGRLIDRQDELADFEVFHFAGHWLAGADELAGAVRRATGDPRIPLKPFPYPMLIALSPFVTMFRELLEMRYLWMRPIGLSGAKLRAFLGEVPATDLDVAVRESLADLGVTTSDHDSPAGAECGRSWTGGAPRPYIAGHVRAHAV